MGIHYEKQDGSRKAVEAEEYDEELPAGPPPPPLIETSTECDHYYVDKGIQVTGERFIGCRDCWHGMEVDPAYRVEGGKLVQPDHTAVP